MKILFLLLTLAIAACSSTPAQYQNYEESLESVCKDGIWYYLYSPNPPQIYIAATDDQGNVQRCERNVDK